MGILLPHRPGSPIVQDTRIIICVTGDYQSGEAITNLGKQGPATNPEAGHRPRCISTMSCPRLAKTLSPLDPVPRHTTLVLQRRPLIVPSNMVVPDALDLVENKRRMRAGELYYTFAPDLVAERERCMAACRAFNLLSTGGEASRRERVEAWKT